MSDPQGNPVENLTEERHLATLVHGRYLMERGARSGASPPLLVGFHGYGESADRHLEALRGIPGIEEWMVISVGALHRFYTKKGDVVASWMTRQSRELEIADNVRYAASVIETVRREEGATGPLVMAGFSQGVAMTWRAALRSGFACHGVIALAGDVPPEYHGDAGPMASVPRWPPVLLGRGVGDTWYTEAKMDEDLAVLQGCGAEVESCVFEGGHEWTPDFHAAAGRFLDQVRARHGAAGSDQDPGPG